MRCVCVGSVGGSAGGCGAGKEEREAEGSEGGFEGRGGTVASNLRRLLSQRCGRWEGEGV